MNQLSSDSNRSYSSGTSEVRVLPSAVNLNNLLSYQDVLQSIEREFHLYEGQEREIIMKLWLKGQTMISILHRYRHLLQDLNLDDQDFLAGFKAIRDLINHAVRDAENLRERTAMLENENCFLEQEFQRQLDRISQEKNEQIARLTKIIDEKFSSTTKSKDSQLDDTFGASTSRTQDDLVGKFMQQNVELQREIETLRAKLEYTFVLINEKFDQHNSTVSSIGLLQTALEKIQQTESKLQEFQWKFSAQREENQLLKYIIEKTEETTKPVESAELLRKVEENSLEREIERVRHELELTEQKAQELQERFKNADETTQFKLEQLKLTCDVLRDHINSCNERMTELNNERKDQEPEKRKQPIDSTEIRRELDESRGKYKELDENFNKLKNELNNVRRRLKEQETTETTLRAQLNNDEELKRHVKRLQTKYDDVCQRLNEKSIELTRVQMSLEQKSNLCEQLEKEKFDITKKSDSLSQNITIITTKYKDKLSTVKNRLEQSDQRYREFENRYEYLQNQFLELRQDFNEKEKLLQDAQTRHFELLLEKQKLEERRLIELEQQNELTVKYRLLEEDFQRLKRQTESDSQRKSEQIRLEFESQFETLKIKISQSEQRLAEEKSSRESLQMQMKILEEDNLNLREIMEQMRKRKNDELKDERDRNDEIQQLIARAELHARQYMSNFNVTSFSTPSAIVRLVPVSPPMLNISSSI